MATYLPCLQLLDLHLICMLGIQVPLKVGSVAALHSAVAKPALRIFPALGRIVELGVEPLPNVAPRLPKVKRGFLSTFGL